jgi:PAS domain S-box-containing protein
MDLNITIWNEGSERIYGIKASEAIGRKILDVVKIIKPSGRELEEQFKNMLSTKYAQFEHVVSTNRGEIWTNVFSQAIKDDKGKEIGRLSIVTDITERKKLEEKLRLTDAGFKAIKEGVIISDIETNITYWNEASETIYGVEASEAIGKKLFDIIEVIKPSQAELKKEFKDLNAIGHTHSEHLIKTKSVKIWVDVSLQAIKNENEENIAILSIMTDISERKKMEEELRESGARLAEAQEIAKLGNWHMDLKTGKLSGVMRCTGSWLSTREVTPSSELFSSLAHNDDREIIKIK